MNPPAEWLDSGSVRPLSPQEFADIRKLAHRAFGLDLKPGKEELVAARLRRLARASGARSFKELYRYVLEDSTGEALAALIDALATNHTSFLREPDHFDFLRHHVLPGLGPRDIDIWSAACSTGEEVWTLACLLSEAVPSRRFRITATDVSRKALAIAERAVYSAERCAGLPASWLSRFFVPEDPIAKTYRVQPSLRTLASFARFNLMEPFGGRRHFPVIFCRNVMIYFDGHTQEQVASKLAASLQPGGYLFVGHAESLTRFSHSLEYIRPAVYRKPTNREGKWSRS